MRTSQYWLISCFVHVALATVKSASQSESECGGHCTWHTYKPTDRAAASRPLLADFHFRSSLVTNVHFGCSFANYISELLQFITIWASRFTIGRAAVRLLITDIDSLWPPCVADADIIFLPCGFFYLSFFFFSSPNLSGRRLDVYHTSTHGVALVRI